MSTSERRECNKRAGSLRAWAFRTAVFLQPTAKLSRVLRCFGHDLAKAALGLRISAASISSWCFLLAGAAGKSHQLRLRQSLNCITQHSPYSALACNTQHDCAFQPDYPQTQRNFAA